MGDPVGMSLETSAAVLGGRQQRNAYRMEAKQLETEKKAIETNAAIAQDERMRKLKTVLAAQNALFAMGGQSAGVGSASAIQAGSMSDAAREQRIENLQTSIAKTAYAYNIKSAKQAAKQSMNTSMLNFAVDFGSRVHSTGMKFLANMMKKKFTGGMGGSGGMMGGGG
ncbi:MAG: hypothetical protein J6S85_03870 [Methanobrevibacter sp.]|nr:hypothetical protein [Methanobrevibacter sp.]MBO7712680.1 hypothetical protein [Methanobrevibacter sp.]